MTKDSYFRHTIPGKDEVDEDSIIPMNDDNAHYSPFHEDESLFSMHENERNMKKRDSSPFPANNSSFRQNCPIHTMARRHAQDKDTIIQRGSETHPQTGCQDLIQHLASGVAFRGFSEPDKSLQYDKIRGIGGEENFSFRQTMGDGPLTNTPIGDWDFEEDQKKNMNGLVDDIYDETIAQMRDGENGENGAMFLQQMKNKKTGHAFASNLLSGNMEVSQVSQLFYSKKNIQALQEGIRYLVYDRSGGRHRIGEQSNDELIIIMKTMYLTHGKNQIYNVLEQVRELNKKVLDFAVPDIIQQLDMYDKYRHDQAFLPTPIDRSLNTSIKGERSLEMRGFF